MRFAPFHDRKDGGQSLAQLLGKYADQVDVMVLALPRGGVPVGFEVARALHAPLDIFVVRKLGVPGCSELAMGAIASGGVRVLNEEVVRLGDISPLMIERVEREECDELTRREHAYRGDRAAIDVVGRRVILVDDGLATGSSMRAAIIALRLLRPSKIIVAVPVAARDICDDLRDEVDEVVCAHTPEHFGAVGYYYEHFDQTTDDEVRELLHRALRFGLDVGQENSFSQSE